MVLQKESDQITNLRDAEVFFPFDKLHLSAATFFCGTADRVRIRLLSYIQLRSH